MTPEQAVQAVRDAGGNKSLAARNAGVSRNTLLWNLGLAAREVSQFPKRENVATNGAITPNAPTKAPRSTLCHVRPNPHKFEPNPHKFEPNPHKFDKPVTHCYIPDTQVKDGVPLEHLEWAGNYIAEKRPDVVIIAGDFADMPSLSSYDRGKRSAENRRYKHDIEAAHRAMEILMTPIVNAKGYQPRLVLTLGNHEDRITRFVDDNPVLADTLTLKDLGYEAWGWEVIPFRQPICIDGVWYCHYFHPQNSSQPYAGANLQTRLQTIGFSFTMGHQQGLRTAVRDLSNGTRQRGLVAGSFYQHYEEYKGPQANSHWQGIIMKHEVKDGNYDLLEVSLDFLRRRYS